VVQGIDRSQRPTGLVLEKKKAPKQANGVAARPPPPPGDPIKPETIQRIFEGGTAVLFATGPSLTEDVVETVLEARRDRKLYLFGCNDAYRIVPTLDVHYACDAGWWNVHYAKMEAYQVAHGLWTQEPRLSKSKFPKLRRIAGRSGAGLSTAQDLIYFGNNSGYQLINLALLFGIKKMVLCGYNMSVIRGKRHFFGDHPEGLSKGNPNGFIAGYNRINPQQYGIEILNATPNTALKAFPIVTLEDALK